MQAQGTIRCSSCDYPNRAERRFCGECGSRLGEVCAACGTQNDPEEHFCGHCGAALSAAPVAPAPPTERPHGVAAPEAERRQLTVMFCDLVASTALAEHIEDEDLREIVRRYYDACAEMIRRWDGHVAQYLGDGILAYFGYPQAHEDDAERAVRAGLDMLRTLERDFAGLNAMLETERGLRLAARIGLHTGPVVVGDMAGGAGREALALGETVNLAARLQGVAAPDTVVISSTTFRLVRGIFVVEDLGRQTLKGVGQPMVVYRVVQPSGVRSRLELAVGALTSFVGRDLELGTLLDRWERVQEREGQTVVITGEAGVGKSRLVYQLRERLADMPHTWLECRCSPYTQDSAFRAVADLVERGLFFLPGDTPTEKVAKLESAVERAGLAQAEAVPLFAAFLGLPPPERYAPLQMSPELQRKKTLEALTAWNLALGELQAIVVLVEDLHWCDPSSLELLGKLIEQSATARVLIVGTARPDFQSPWAARSNLTPLNLSRLTGRQAREMVAALSDGSEALPADVIDAIVTRADGIPLYLEELARALVEPGALRAIATIPATLQDSLMARLDRQGPAKEVAQRAAVLGREFSYTLLAAVAEIEEGTLRKGIIRLVEAEILFARGEPPAARYTFKHALVQEAAYESLLRRTRQALHARVAQILEERFPDEVAAGAEVVARHYDAAGHSEQAIGWYQRAGEQAQARSAHEEAIRHFRLAVVVAGTLPSEVKRAACEVRLQLALGASVVAVRGYSHPETEAAYERARVVCETVGDVAQLGSALVGLSLYYSNRGEPGRGVELAGRVVEIGQQIGDESLIIHGHVQAAIPNLYLGRPALSVEHCEQAIALYEPSRHHAAAFLYGTDQAVAALGFAALSQWVRGYPEQALGRIREAVALGRRLAHPFSLAFALAFETFVHWIRRDVGAQRELAEQTISLSEALGFPLWLGLGRAFRGNALVASGDATAVAQISEGLALAASTGNQGAAPALMGLLAEAQQTAGLREEALGTVEIARAVAAQSGQQLWDAELQRLAGALLLAAPSGSEADAAGLFGSALQIAHAQEARSLELRAATTLARLLRVQGKPAEARAVLAPLYGWFTEGFDTADLVEAKALLEELGHP